MGRGLIPVLSFEPEREREGVGIKAFGFGQSARGGADFGEALRIARREARAFQEVVD